MNDEVFVRAFVRKNRAAGSHAFFHPEGEFVVYEGVFSPTVFNDTFFYAEALPVPVGGSVLEVGCGTGFIALSVAKKGAGSVLATDVNPSAVANCKANSEKHNLSDVVTTRISDVFSAVTADERFDLIFWNWPYFDAQRNEDDPLECSVFDPTYESIGRYLRDARAHRSPQGRVMLSFSREAGNLSLLEQRAREAGASLSAFRTSDKFDGIWVLEILEATYDLLGTRPGSLSAVSLADVAEACRGCPRSSVGRSPGARSFAWPYGGRRIRRPPQRRHTGVRGIKPNQDRRYRCGRRAHPRGPAGQSGPRLSPGAG
jgi:release factor glutamine methyltransferase